MCIFMGCVFAYVIVLTLVGPEYLGRSFDVQHDSDLSEAAGRDNVESALAKLNRGEGGVDGSDPEDTRSTEKGNVTTAERS